MRHETARLRALDRFCGAGGGARGLQQAGFHVTGVDLAPQPRYCGDAFIQADVLDLAPQPQDCCDPFLQAVALELSIEFLRGFDFLWASPPCQAHSALRHAHNARRRDDLIAATREMLVASGRPYVIENVVGAPLLDPFMLCGSSFGLQTPGGPSSGDIESLRQASPSSRRDAVTGRAPRSSEFTAVIFATAGARPERTTFPRLTSAPPTLTRRWGSVGR
jgi:DNA (cytosine-5)-methyltransferase 1